MPYSHLLVTTKSNIFSLTFITSCILGVSVLYVCFVLSLIWLFLFSQNKSFISLVCLILLYCVSLKGENLCWPLRHSDLLFIWHVCQMYDNYHVLFQNWSSFCNDISFIICKASINNYFVAPISKTLKTET